MPGTLATATIAGGGGTNQPIVNTNETVALTNVTAGTPTVAAALTSKVIVSGTGKMTINAGNQVTGNVQADPANGMIHNNGTIAGALIVNGGTVNVNATDTAGSRSGTSVFNKQFEKSPGRARFQDESAASRPPECGWPLR